MFRGKGASCPQVTLEELWNTYIYIFIHVCMGVIERDWERKNVVVKANIVKYSHPGDQGEGYSRISCAILVTFL